MTRTTNLHDRVTTSRSRTRLTLPAERLTVVEARLQVPPGGCLYIRGQGDGLSWTSGQRLNRGFGGSWIWLSPKAKGRVRFRLLLNDCIKAKGRDLIVAAGKLIEVAPVF
jgi:hypothetical protein